MSSRVSSPWRGGTGDNRDPMAIMDASERGSEPADGWAGSRAARWTAHWEALDRQLGAVSDELMAVAAVQPGERVLDVGCGTGPTARLAADAAGARGSVVGVDVAAEMIAAARQVPVSTDAAPIEWVHADAATWHGTGAPFDVVQSRFGVMFFGDPDAAFANLRRLTAPTGRLAVATWQERAASPLFDLPLSIALDRCARRGLDPELPPQDGGPFSLHERAAHELLQRTGWREIRTQPHELSLPVGGGASPANAAAMSLEFGPARIVADHLTDAQRQEVRVAIEAAYADHVDADGSVRLVGAIVITTARP